MIDILINILTWVAILAGVVGLVWGLVLATLLYFKWKAEMYVAEKAKKIFDAGTDIIKEKIK